MSLTEQYRSMARYNRWMNTRLYAVCATLSDSERKRDRSAFFRSIHGTLNHLVLTDRAWLWRFTKDSRIATSLDENGNPIRLTGAVDQELYADFERLTAERAKTDADIEAWTATLDEAKLLAPLAYRTGKGEPFEHPLWWAVTHFFNHQTHHRGQVTTLLSQQGLDPGVTDLVILLRSQTDASP